MNRLSIVWEGSSLRVEGQEPYCAKIKIDMYTGTVLVFGSFVGTLCWMRPKYAQATAQTMMASAAAKWYQLNPKREIRRPWRRSSRYISRPCINVVRRFRNRLTTLLRHMKHVDTDLYPYKPSLSRSLGPSLPSHRASQQGPYWRKKVRMCKRERAGSTSC